MRTIASLFKVDEDLIKPTFYTNEKGQVIQYNNHVRCLHCGWELFKHTATKDEDIGWHTCRLFTCSNYDCRLKKPKWYLSKEVHTYKGVWYKPWTWGNWEVIKDGK